LHLQWLAYEAVGIAFADGQHGSISVAFRERGHLFLIHSATVTRRGFSPSLYVFSR
jgi:hypothetical protein